MANAQGGIIVIGVSADNEGIPTAVVGVDRGNYADPVISSSVAAIDRRISGLECSEIDLADGKQVVVILVPRSPSGPHMVTYKGLNQFWKRHGRQKQPMSTAEITEAVEANMSATERLKEFIRARERDVQVLIGNTPFLTISACPLPLEDDILDVRDRQVRALVRDPSRASPRFGSNIQCGTPQPTLEGLAADTYLRLEQDLPEGEYLEVHRNGYCEFGDCLASRDGGLPARLIALETHGFVEFVTALYAAAGLNGPYAFWLKLHHVSNSWLGSSSRTRRPPKDDARRWKKQDLETRRFMASDLEAEGAALARMLNDRLWNAFGYEQALIYDEQGKLKA